MSDRTAKKKSSTTKKNKKKDTHDQIDRNNDDNEKSLPCSEIKNKSSDKQIESFDISDDTLDYLDSEIDKFNNTTKLGEKISIHKKLELVTKNLIDEINNMVSIVDNIDKNIEVDESSDDIEDINIDDMFVNIEKMLEDMKNDEPILMKIKHYERIMNIVKKCRTKCSKKEIMNITKCNF